MAGECEVTMGTILPFPVQPQPRRTQKTEQPVSKLVAIRGLSLEMTLETVAFFRSIDNQCYLDGFNRTRLLNKDS